MRYILHYTEPGDIVFDGFCGTGMTGIAAQLCGDRSVLASLGYRVDSDGTISEQEPASNGASWRRVSRLGARRAILNDISPAATFISQNYNMPVDKPAFQREANRILAAVEKEYGWMYETFHTDGKTKGRINFTLWSDVFHCSECAGEIVFWNVAADKNAAKVQDTFACPHCTAELSKRRLSRAFISKIDQTTHQPVQQAKQVPVLINYSVGKTRYEKAPDAKDLEIIEKAEAMGIPDWFPSERMMEGGETRRNDPIGLTHTHHFYTRRNLATLSKFRAEIFSSLARTGNSALGLWFTSSHVWATRLNRLLASNYFKSGGGVIGQTLQGTLYVSSLSIETNCIERFSLRINSVPYTAHGGVSLVSTGSAADVAAPDSSADYLFIDPPFGANIMYSELNSLWEAWLKVKTNPIAEAVENKSQGKSLDDYRQLMSDCFKEAFRILKPGRWMTVEFSNTRAAVWNGIQTSLQEAGFVVANVAALRSRTKDIARLQQLPLSNKTWSSPPTNPTEVWKSDSPKPAAPRNPPGISSVAT